MAMENRLEPVLRHSIVMENRASLQITGVLEVESFDEETVILITEPGELIIKGQDIHISHIDVASGNLNLTGTIDQLSYTTAAPKRSGIFGRLFG